MNRHAFYSTMAATIAARNRVSFIATWVWSPSRNGLVGFGIVAEVGSDVLPSAGNLLTLNPIVRGVTSAPGDTVQVDVEEGRFTFD